MDQFAPMLASVATVCDATRVAGDDHWAFEPKINGHRRIIVKTAREIAGWSRKGLQANLPAGVRAEFARLQVDVILDGELVDDVWVCFDVLMFDGHSLLGMPWHKRRAALERVFAQWQPGSSVLLITVARTLTQKAKLLARIKAQRAEGVVAKEINSGYKPAVRPKDRSDLWLKLKLTKTVDCVVEFFGQDRQNMSLGVYRDDLESIDPAVAELLGIDVEPLEPTDVGEVSRLTGDGPTIVFACYLQRWLTALGGDVEPVVVEVTVLYCSRDYRLVQPVTPRLRWPDDKPAAHCTWDQLEAIIPLDPVL